MISAAARGSAGTQRRKAIGRTIDVATWKETSTHLFGYDVDGVRRLTINKATMAVENTSLTL